MNGVCTRFVASIPLVFLCSDALGDLEVSASPSRPQVGQQVMVWIDAGAVPPSCALHVDFGDATPEWSQECTAIPCEKRAQHVYSAPGVYTITARTRVGPCGGREGTSTVTVQCTPLEVSTTGVLSSGSVGKAYSEQIQTAGGRPPVRFSVASGSLPAGLTLNASGLLSGAPTKAGDHSFAIRATDSCPGGAVQTVQKRFTISVEAPCEPLRISTDSALPRGRVEQMPPYKEQIQATGRPPIRFSIAPEAGRLPPGLNLAPSGLLSGRPSRAGKFSFRVLATDSCPGGRQTGSRSFTLAVDPQKQGSKTPPVK